MEHRDLSLSAASDALQRAREKRSAVTPVQSGQMVTNDDRSFPMLVNKSESDDGQQLSLFTPSPSPLPLRAYLACALTGLTEEQRQHLFSLSDIIADTCSSYGIALYQPRHHTDPAAHPGVSASDVYHGDRQRVLESDVVIHLCHHPSTGAGEELEFARSALLPIILIFPDDLKVSRMILGIPSLVLQIPYREIDDLIGKLSTVLFDFRPFFEQRKMAFSKYSVNVVGEKIREVREKAKLTRSEVADASSRLSAERFRAIEEQSDLESNPNLIELREIATILKTTVAELVEPNIWQQVFIELKNWQEGRAAARTYISADDQKRIIKGILRRMADEL